MEEEERDGGTKERESERKRRKRKDRKYLLRQMDRGIGVFYQQIMVMSRLSTVQL